MPPLLSVPLLSTGCFKEAARLSFAARWQSLQLHASRRQRWLAGFQGVEEDDGRQRQKSELTYAAAAPLRFLICFQLLRSFRR